MTYYESTNLKKETKKYRKALPCFSILKKRDRLSANKQQSFFTNLKSHFKVMYLCNYNQKNVRKNTFLWAIGKIPLFMRFFIMFMFMSIGISYAETVHSQNAAMEFRFQYVTIEKAL